MAANLIEGFERTNIVSPNGAKLQINDVLYASISNKNLLKFKDICQNEYHIEISSEDNFEFLFITSIISCQKHVLEKHLLFLLGCIIQL